MQVEKETPNLGETPACKRRAGERELLSRKDMIK